MFVRYHFLSVVCELLTEGRTAYEILKNKVFDILMTGNGEFAVVFVKLK